VGATFLTGSGAFLVLTGSGVFLAAVVDREDFFTGSVTFLAGSATFLVGSGVFFATAVVVAAAFGLVAVDFSPFSLVAGVAAVVVAVFFAHGVVLGFVVLVVAVVPPSSFTHGGRNVVRPPGALLALLVPARGVTNGISSSLWELLAVLSTISSGGLFFFPVLLLLNSPGADVVARLFAHSF